LVVDFWQTIQYLFRIPTNKTFLVLYPIILAYNVGKK